MYQQTMIIGRLGADPEMRYTPSGVPVANLPVAVNRRWTKDGEKHEETTWFNVTAWNQAAEFAAEYLRRGAIVLCVGEMRASDPYQAKDGTWRASLELTARVVRSVGGRSDDSPGTHSSEEPPNNVQDVDSIPF
jgi:single-strand DNA-binding protein